MKNLLAAGVSIVVLSFASAAFADAGFVALEGSDATALHHDSSYTPQLFKYLQGASSKSVLVYNPAGVIDLSAITGGVAVTNKTSLTGLTLSDYSALYIESPGGCCAADNTVLNGFGAAVSAFIAAGGNLSIENYIGGGYDGVVLGGAAAPLGTIQGFGTSNGGIGGGPTCTDGETVTAFGISKGFSQPPVDGCWSHQAYETTYWGGLGYSSLMKADPAFTFRADSHDGSSFLAIGGTLGTPTEPGIPEPASWAMMLVGFFGLGSMLRRRRGLAATA
jgi:hypothetical protein